jgi:hypothetical protein
MGYLSKLLRNKGSTCTPKLELGFDNTALSYVAVCPECKIHNSSVLMTFPFFRVILAYCGFESNASSACPQFLLPFSTSENVTSSGWSSSPVAASP